MGVPSLNDLKHNQPTNLNPKLFQRSPEKSTFPILCKNIDLYSNECVVSLTLSVCVHNSLLLVQNNWFHSFRSNYFIPIFQKVSYPGRGFPLPHLSPARLLCSLANTPENWRLFSWQPCHHHLYKPKIPSINSACLFIVYCKQ